MGKALSGEKDSFWLYKVNHAAPEVGGDQLEIDSGDEVLWYFSDTVLRGTKGPDGISAAGGDDRVDGRGGSSDVVRCGPGRDHVRATKADRVARDCERVNGKARG